MKTLRALIAITLVAGLLAAIPAGAASGAAPNLAPARSDRLLDLLERAARKIVAEAVNRVVEVALNDLEGEVISRGTFECDRGTGRPGEPDFWMWCSRELRIASPDGGYKRWYRFRISNLDKNWVCQPNQTKIPNGCRWVDGGEPGDRLTEVQEHRRRNGIRVWTIIGGQTSTPDLSATALSREEAQRLSKSLASRAFKVAASL